MKILLVDDEVEILEILGEYLELEHHSVVKAENGKEALDIVLNDPSIDVVFSVFWRKSYHQNQNYIYRIKFCQFSHYHLNLDLYNLF